MSKRVLTQRLVHQVKPVCYTQEFYDTQVSTLFLRVYPSGNGYFFVRVQHDGLRQTYKLGASQSLSLRKARQQARLLLQKVRSPLAHELPPITLLEFSKEFFRRYPRHWKPRTLEKNKGVFRCHLAPTFGETLVQDIERKAIEKWFGQMAHAKGSANQGLVLLSVMMQQCEAWGYRLKNTNPCRKFKRYKGAEVERYLSDNELQRLWQALNRLEGKYAIAVMAIRLLIYTGCRTSEVRLLRWVDYRCGHWHLSDSKTGEKVVYLNTCVRRYLREWQSNSPYVFHGKTQAEPLSQGALSRVWKIVCQEAELESVRLHDLRHTYASVAIQSKVSLLVLSRLLGHAQSETTLKYAHLGHADVSQAASRVAKLLADGMRL